MIIGPYILSFWDWVIIIGFALIGACCVCGLAVGIITWDFWLVLASLVALGIYYVLVLKKVFDRG